MAEQKDKKQPVLTRRDVLKITGATGATVFLSQILTSGPLSADAVEGLSRETHASAEHEWHMGIDLSKCIGCQYCL